MRSGDAAVALRADHHLALERPVHDEPLRRAQGRVVHRHRAHAPAQEPWCRGCFRRTVGAGIGSADPTKTEGIQLIYAGPHCHAPSCISMELSPPQLASWSHRATGKRRTTLRVEVQREHRGAAVRHGPRLRHGHGGLQRGRLPPHPALRLGQPGGPLPLGAPPHGAAFSSSAERQPRRTARCLRCCSPSTPSSSA